MYNNHVFEEGNSPTWRVTFSSYQQKWQYPQRCRAKYQLSTPVQISCSLECLPNFAQIGIMQAILLIDLTHIKEMKIYFWVLPRKDKRVLHTALDGNAKADCWAGLCLKQEWQISQFWTISSACQEHQIQVFYGSNGKGYYDQLLMSIMVMERESGSLSAIYLSSLT